VVECKDFSLSVYAGLRHKYSTPQTLFTRARPASGTLPRRRRNCPFVPLRRCAAPTGVVDKHCMKFSF